MDDIPVLYVYIYSIICDSRSGQFIKPHELRNAVSKIIRRMPGKIYHDLFKDMESYQLIKYVNVQKYEILENKRAKQKMERLKQVFW